MKIRYAPLAVACALMVAATAQAAPVTYYFGGTVATSGLSSVAVGDTFSGSFTFESTAPDLDPDPGNAFYATSFAINATVNGYAFSSSTTASDCPLCGSVQVIDAAGSLDRLIAQNFLGGPAPLTGPDIDGLSPYGLSVDLQDSSGLAFNNDALPANLVLSSFNFTEFALLFANGSGNLSVTSGPLTYVTLTPAPPVPEASTTAMLALGLGALAFVRRRKGH